MDGDSQSAFEYGDIEKNTGWLASVNWKGKVLERSASWSYDYRTLEADAVIGSFVDSDVAGGRTDQRSHRLSAEMGVIEGFSLGGAAIFSTLSSQGDGIVTSGGCLTDRSRILINSKNEVRLALR